MRYLMFIMLILCCCAGCGGYEDALSVSKGGALITGGGWPDAVPPVGAVLYLSPATRLAPQVGVDVVVSDSSGGVRLSTNIQADPGNGMVIIRLPNLEGAQHYSFVASGLEDDSGGALPAMRTNFQTANGAIVLPPSVVSTWPAAYDCVCLSPGFRFKVVFSRRVLRDSLRVVVAAPGGYRYLVAAEKGGGNSATFAFPENCRASGSYRVTIGGVRGEDQVYGSGIAVSFSGTNASSSQTNGFPLLFSELCWQYESGNVGSEFIEIYNPTPHERNLAAEGVRLYRSSGSSWTLLCDFSKKGHFAASRIQSTIPGFGYLLLANERAAALWPAADGFVLDSRMTMSGEDGFALTRTGPPGKGNSLDMVSFSEKVGDDSSYITAPPVGQSVERKARADATTLDMGNGGIYRLCGNSFVSGNVAADFILRSSPEPQHAALGIEIP